MPGVVMYKAERQQNLSLWYAREMKAVLKDIK